MPELMAIARIVGIALACGGALVGINWLTEEKIRYNEAAQLRSAILDLLPANSMIPVTPVDINQVPGAWMLCSGYLLGRSDAKGYGGDIRLLYTLRNSLRTSSRTSAQATASARFYLMRLAVLGHQETPGIADFLRDPAWLSSFSDLQAAEIEELSAVTGATITSAAVREHLASILREPAGRLGAPVQMACGE